jgi:hypothetical protein
MPIAATAYVSPALRNKKPLTAATAAPPSTKKTALKKEFAIEASAFPSLGDTIKTSTNRGTPISFSSAAAKKVAPPSVEIIDVLPGWVHLRRHAGQIQYKYGEMKYLSAADEERADEIRSRIILKNRIAREEYDRNVNIERLGDLSEYYGQPSLAEMYETDVYYVSEDSDSNMESGLDSDHYE